MVFLGAAFPKIDSEKSPCLELQIWKSFAEISYHKNLSLSDTKTVLVHLVDILAKFTKNVFFYFCYLQGVNLGQSWTRNATISYVMLS